MIDESGADLGMSSEYARAEGGARAKAAKPHLRGSRYSIIGAVGVSGIIASTYLKSAVNTEIFEVFVKELLVPHLGYGKYVVMDNVRFHKNREIVKLIEDTGAKVVFLPPYSPDLSPIEKMWSKTKEILKRSKPRSDAQFHDALATALDAISEEDLQGWYTECGYSVEV